VIEPASDHLSIAAQCHLLGMPRSQYYYEPVGESELNLALMNRIDEMVTEIPFYGSRRVTAQLNVDGHSVNRKRVQRLMRLMGIETTYCKPRTTVRNPEHRVFPYLLRGVEITRPNQVWSTDITYVRMRQGFLYLVAVMDWYSRYVLAWELSNQMSTDFCLEALNRCWRYGAPEIFNSDQGSQFTSNHFVKCLLDRQVKVSMDGKGRCIDNVYIERLWRSVKYEEIYLKDYSDGREASSELGRYFNVYNQRRLHSSLKYRPPANLYC